MSDNERADIIRIQAMDGQFSVNNADALKGIAGEKVGWPEMTLDSSPDIALDFSAIQINLGYGESEWRKLPPLPVEWIILGEVQKRTGFSLEGQPKFRTVRGNMTDTAKKIHIIGKEIYGDVQCKIFVEFENTDEMIADGHQMDRGKARAKFKELIADGWKLF